MSVTLPKMFEPTWCQASSKEAVPRYPRRLFYTIPYGVRVKRNVNAEGGAHYLRTRAGYFTLDWLSSDPGADFSFVNEKTT